MWGKGYTIGRLIQMGCCNCFGFSFTRKSKTAVRPTNCFHDHDHDSHQLLLDEDVEEDVEEDEGDYSLNGDVTDTGNGDDDDFQSLVKKAEEIIHYRIRKGLHCREFPVKDTHILIRSEVEFFRCMRLYTVHILGLQ